jgi:transporter family-2 protein
VSSVLYAGFAFVVGAGLAAQAAVNTGLREYVGGPVIAAAVSFLVGLIFLLVVALIAGAASGVSPLRLAAAPWWAWVGGVIGAIYILASIVLTPKVGVGVVISLAVAGQLVGALIIDQFGLFGLPAHQLSPLRAVGVALLICGAVLVRFF